MVNVILQIIQTYSIQNLFVVQLKVCLANSIVKVKAAPLLTRAKDLMIVLIQLIYKLATNKLINFVLLMITLHVNKIIAKFIKSIALILQFNFSLNAFLLASQMNFANGTN